MLKKHSPALVVDMASIKDIGVSPIDEDTIKTINMSIDNILTYATVAPTDCGKLEALVHAEFGKVCARVLEAGRAIGEPNVATDMSKTDADKFTQSLTDESQRMVIMLNFDEGSLRTHQQ